VSEFTADVWLKQFTPAGAATGNQFSALWGNTAGGLAFDTVDSTLWIGAFLKRLSHLDDRTLLGSFAVPSPMALRRRAGVQVLRPFLSLLLSSSSPLVSPCWVRCSKTLS